MDGKDADKRQRKQYQEKNRPLLLIFQFPLNEIVALVVFHFTFEQSVTLHVGDMMGELLVVFLSQSTVRGMLSELVIKSQHSVIVLR